MARARNLKPGFFTNEDLAECSPMARLLFAGLWTLADREGRLEDRHKRIKGQLFAYDSIEVEPLLQELAERRFILRYQVDGQRLIQVVEFLKHQNPHHREPESILPPPQSPGLPPNGNHAEPKAPQPSDDIEAQGKPEASPGQAPGFEPKDAQSMGVKPCGFRSPDSGALIPDTGNEAGALRIAPSTAAAEGARPDGQGPEPPKAAAAPLPGPPGPAGPPDPNAPTPAMHAAVQLARTSGYPDVSPGDLKLRAMVAQGLTTDELAAACADGVRGGKGWGWVLKAVQGRRQDAAAVTLAPLPAAGLGKPPPAGPTPGPDATAAYLADRDKRAALAVPPPEAIRARWAARKATAGEVPAGETTTERTA